MESEREGEVKKDIFASNEARNWNEHEHADFIRDSGLPHDTFEERPNRTFVFVGMVVVAGLIMTAVVLGVQALEGVSWDQLWHWMKR